MNVFLSGGGNPDQSAVLDSVFFGLLHCLNTAIICLGSSYEF